MGRDHYVKTNQWDTFTCGSGTFYVSRSLGCGPWTDPPPPWPQKWTARSELKGLSVDRGFSAPVRSTSQHCPPPKWTSYPLLKESKRHRREVGTKNFMDNREVEEKAQERADCWSSITYVKPSGTHIYFTVYLMTALCWYHLCFCKIIYSAKMVFYFSLLEIQSGSIWFIFSKELAKIKCICIFSGAEWHLHWM